MTIDITISDAHWIAMMEIARRRGYTSINRPTSGHVRSLATDLLEIAIQEHFECLLGMTIGEWIGRRTRRCNGQQLQAKAAAQ